MPDIDQIIRWEDGEMDRDEEIIFFQGLVESGLAWTLQGRYGRRAAQLIQQGEKSKTIA